MEGPIEVHVETRVETTVEEAGAENEDEDHLGVSYSVVRSRAWSQRTPYEYPPSWGGRRGGMASGCSNEPSSHLDQIIQEANRSHAERAGPFGRGTVCGQRASRGRRGTYAVVTY